MARWRGRGDDARVHTRCTELQRADVGGAGNFYQRQKERGEVMTREDVETRMKAGLLSYSRGPFGGCTKSGGCDKRKGLALIDISCATDGCKNLVGKHSKIIRVIQLKRVQWPTSRQVRLRVKLSGKSLRHWNGLNVNGVPKPRSRRIK